MATHSAGLVEMSLVFGSVLTFLIWELVSLHRMKQRDARRAEEEEAENEKQKER
jgi:hypothetical protein